MKVFSCILITFFVFLFGNFTLAQENILEQAGIRAGYTTEAGIINTPPQLIIARIIKIFLGFLGITAVSFIVYGGWVWLRSEGSQEKITTAKGIIIGASVGIAIIISSYAIAEFIIREISSSI